MAILLSNAIKYLPQDSAVKFDLVCEQNHAILQIQDESIGISLEDQQHLFESFHRGSNVSTTSETGLEIAMSNGLWTYTKLQSNVESRAESY